VEEGEPGFHQKWGWETFTDEVIRQVSEQREHVIFLLWGKFAHDKEKLIDQDRHLILKAAHPSPLSTYRGFFGSKPFSKTNEYLKTNKLKEIKW
jgi:uracil-DNA glycosylase